LASVALAKLPPLTDDEKAKAAEATAKSAWADKVDLYKLCRAQDRIAQKYRDTAKSEGKTPAPTATTPPCADPGAYVAITPVESKPSEASEAHSQPGTAISPPSTNKPAADSGRAK